MKSIIFPGCRFEKWPLFLILFIQWLFFSVQAQVPVISKIEYFLDTDPGFGNATNLSFTGTTTATGTINIDLVPLSQGVHIVGVRSRDANGAWSLDNKWLFLKPYSTSAVLQPNITQVEWFLDTDPGYGNATALAISSAQDLPGLSFNIDLSSLSQGVHIVGVRSKDANGAWSLDNKWLFLKPYSTSETLQPNINRVEWYLDRDPGYGNATSVSISPAQNLSGLSFNIDMAALSQGVHIVGVRSKDANGGWSLDNKWIFLKPYADGPGPVPGIVKMEYFIDVDPGYGKASSISITPANDISMLVFDADISNVSNGAHKLGIRSLDANGAWSLDNKVEFTTVITPISWTGVTSTDWNTPGNWSKGIVPTVLDNVIIPSGTPFSPVIASGITGNCKSIILNPGAIVTVATGGNLKVAH